MCVCVCVCACVCVCMRVRMSVSAVAPPPPALDTREGLKPDEIDWWLRLVGLPLALPPPLNQVHSPPLDPREGPTHQ